MRTDICEKVIQEFQLVLLKILLDQEINLIPTETGHQKSYSSNRGEGGN